MTAQTVAEPSNDLACDRCGMTTDQCLSLREDCCVGCTHYPEPADDDVDEIAVERAVNGDLSVPLNRADFAEAHRRLEAARLSAAQIADRLGASQRNVVRWRNGHSAPISRRPGGRAMDTTDELLTRAARHSSARVQTAARRAQDALQRVRDLLAEDEGKREARERVERLERELREAKAALRGKPTRPATAPTVRPQTAAVDGGIPCPNDCGKVSVNAAGASAHARFCKHTPAAAQAS